MGGYPIFIYSTRFTEELDESYLTVRIKELVRELSNKLPDESARRRVYSVFAVKSVASTFAQYWTQMTGIGIEQTPYYDAKFSYCIPTSLTGLPEESVHDHTYNPVERLGEMGDVERVAELCHGFAADSVSAHSVSVKSIALTCLEIEAPFVLTPQRAFEEAHKLISARQLWVLEVNNGHWHAPEIACIVALTRSTRSIATITKVYTLPRWRSKGFAFRLVRHVCDQYVVSSFTASCLDLPVPLLISYRFT